MKQRKILIFGVILSLFGALAPFLFAVLYPHSIELFLLIPICSLILNIPVMIMLIQKTPRYVYKQKPVRIGIYLNAVVFVWFMVQAIYTGGRAFIGLILLTPIIISLLFLVFYVSLLVGKVFPKPEKEVSTDVRED
jgi:hypothetical protein